MMRFAATADEIATSDAATDPAASPTINLSIKSFISSPAIPGSLLSVLYSTIFIHQNKEALFK